MSNAMNDVNQPDANKADKNPFKASELNATHQLIQLKQQIVILSQEVQAILSLVANLDKISRKVLEKVEKEFPDLIAKTNLLAELITQVKKTKFIPIEERYKKAKQKVELIQVSADYDNKNQAENKKFFFEFEEALDNTDIIAAFPHEASLFKVAVVYKFFLDEYPSPTLIERLIAIRKADLSDRFKYIKKNNIRVEANSIELAEQAYFEILNGHDENTQKRFRTSYEKFKEIYLGLIKVKNVDTVTFQLEESNFPNIPNTLPGVTEQQLQPKTNTKEPLKHSNRNYYTLSANEFTTLQDLIPDHLKKTDFIPSIGGIAFERLMRTCLAKQIVTKEVKEAELRKRTAAERFILKACGILMDASRAMQEDKIGKLFDPHHGFVSYKADPDAIFKEIKKEYENYQKEPKIIQDCKLSGAELTDAFFTKAISLLERTLANELAILKEQYKKNQIKKATYIENEKQIKHKYEQLVAESKNLEKMINLIGAKNFTIFAADVGDKDNKPSFSVPNDKLINDHIENAGFSLIVAREAEQPDEQEAVINTVTVSEISVTNPLITFTEQIANSSQPVHAKMDSVMDVVNKVDGKLLAELNKEFSNLIPEINILVEQVKKLSSAKETCYDELYKKAWKLVQDGDFKVNPKKNKKLFLEFEKALDNTDIIDAFPHEASLFKVAILYQLFLDDYPPPIVIERLIAIRKADLPDRFKYIKKQDIRVKANYIELAEQAYLEILNRHDVNTQQRFRTSYEKFKEIYLGLMKLNKIGSEVCQVNESKFPEILDTSPEDEVTEPELQQKTNTKELFKQSFRKYYTLNANELTTLQLLIPAHQENFFIPSIGGISLERLMRICLSQQIAIKETNDAELRKRTAAEKFIFKSGVILNDASRAMQEDKIGKIPHQGMGVDPDAIFKKIEKEYENYQKQKIITLDCNLSGTKLTDAFFSRAITLFENASALESELIKEQYTKKQIQKTTLKKNQKQINEKYDQLIVESKNLEKMIKPRGAKNFTIFAAEADGKASFSVPNDELINEGIEKAGFSLIPAAAF